MTTEELQTLYSKNPDAFNPEELKGIPGFSNSNLQERTKPHKYWAKPVRTEDGFFGSTSEKDRFEALKQYQEQGIICFLDRQVKIEVITSEFWEYEGKFLQPIFYKADFQYYHLEWCCWVVEDWKSEKTRTFAEYKMKRQLFIQRFPSIRFVETGKHKVSAKI